MTRVGFIGVGLMGHGMAGNILEAGFPLTVMAHRNRAPVEDLVAKGAVEVASPAEMARSTDLIVMCVTDSIVVDAVVAGPEGLLEGAGDGLLIADATTADPAETLRIAALLAAKGATFIDAPVTRGVKDAEAGRLISLCGGEAEAVERGRPVLATYSEFIHHCGPLGAGHKLKLLNNFISQAQMALVAEAVTLAKRLDADLSLMLKVFSKGGADSHALRRTLPHVISGEETGSRFTIRNARKDVRYASKLAEDATLALPVIDAVQQTLTRAVANGHGDSFTRQLWEAVDAANRE